MTFRKWWNPAPAKAALEAAGRETLARAAAFMVERARQLAPVDTGALRDSIQAVPSLGGSRINVVATAPYAQFQEFGFYAGGVTWVAPRAFLRQALSETATRWPEFTQGVRVARPSESGTPAHLGATFQTTT